MLFLKDQMKNSSLPTYANEKHLYTDSDTMPVWARKSKSRREQILLGLSMIALFLLTATCMISISQSRTNKSMVIATNTITADDLKDPLEAAGARSQNAYCISLTRASESKFENGSDDRYFTATRSLIYQILHDPATRSKRQAAVVVLVNKDVNIERQERLRKDGAVVVQADPVTASPELRSIVDQQSPDSPWVRVIEKLQVFKFTMFERILLLEPDTVIVQSLDKLFNTPAAALVTNKGKGGKIKGDEAQQPASYVMASNSGPRSFPADGSTPLNPAFVLLKPSKEMYQYYMSIASTRFSPSSPEQNLWTYAHRPDGNMPWAQIDPYWTTSTPNWFDFEHGVASFQLKWWGGEEDVRLRDLARAIRWKMEGFWVGKGQG